MTPINPSRSTTDVAARRHVLPVAERLQPTNRAYQELEDLIRDAAGRAGLLNKFEWEGRLNAVADEVALRQTFLPTDEDRS